MEFLFWLSIFLVFHSYILYPLILRLLAFKKIPNSQCYSSGEDLPSVSVLMSAYNEERVMRQKLESLMQSDYPKNLVEIYIGSDKSSDQTNSIITEFSKIYNNIKPVFFESRQGKTNIINQLTGKASGEILVLTDVNVIFERQTIYQLIKHFRNKEIDIVGGNIINTNIKADGISFQEKTYLDNENKMKYREGIIWGSIMGAFGGCYAIRKSKYPLVPHNHLVDDFYITMSVLASGGKAINEPAATCYEDVSNKLYEEFRRKIRISIGNFQNLKAYKKLLWPSYKGIAFSFFSHKVLRWFTPIFIITAFVLNFFIFEKNLFYKLLLVIQAFLMLCPLIDGILKKIKIHNLIIRFITHFYIMNLTLLIGLIISIKGVKTSIWEPTKRYQ